MMLWRKLGAVFASARTFCGERTSSMSGDPVSFRRNRKFSPRGSSEISPIVLVSCVGKSSAVAGDGAAQMRQAVAPAEAGIDDDIRPAALLGIGHLAGFDPEKRRRADI